MGKKENDDTEALGWKFGHFTVPECDYERNSSVRCSSVAEGMFTVGKHKCNDMLAVGQLLASKQKNTWQPAGIHAQHKMCAATELLFADVEHGFKHCHIAKSSCLMGHGLLFLRNSGDVWMSLGHSTFGFLGLQCFKQEVDDITFIRPPCHDGELEVAMLFNTAVGDDAADAQWKGLPASACEPRVFTGYSGARVC
jgi:hypothetical protein